MRLPLASGRKSEAQCPHLGFAEDPFTRGQHASDEHRCYAQLGRERIDLAHQRRFCLTAAHGACPFLLVSARAERPALLEQARAGWRTVSLSRPVLPADQLGRMAGLVPAAGQLVLQTWRAVRPAPAIVGRDVTPMDRESTPIAMESLREESTPIGMESLHEESTPIGMESLREESTPIGMESLREELTPREMDSVLEEEVTPVEPAEALLARGIAAINGGADGYPLFKAATKSDKASVSAWFWRAKTAETLDEVVHCLMRANALEPRNELIADNLGWASARRDANQVAKAAAKGPGTPTHKPLKRQQPSHLRRALSAVANVLRTAAALVTFALAAAWLLVALPGQIREDVLRASGLQVLPLPDITRLTATIHIPLGGGYDAATALPYGIAFFTAFVGIGLLNRERWTRLWVPALIVGSAWLIG